MSKGKSVFITALIAVMAALLILGVYCLGLRALFFAVLGVLAGIGFACLVGWLYAWICKDEEDDPLPVDIPEARADSVEEILAEFGGEE